MSLENESEFEKAKREYNERSSALSEMRRLLQAECWVQENEQKFHDALLDERHFMRRSFEENERLLKLRYASRALTVGKLEPKVVQEIFFLSDEEMRSL